MTMWIAQQAGILLRVFPSEIYLGPTIDSYPCLLHEDHELPLSCKIGKGLSWADISLYLTGNLEASTISLE